MSWEVQTMRRKTSAVDSETGDIQFVFRSQKKGTVYSAPINGLQ
jgi:hypothetical protein